MASEIEKALYGECADRVSDAGFVGQHCVVEFGISRDQSADCSDVVRLCIVREQREFAPPTVAIFADTALTELIRGRGEPDFLPWSIVGFYSDRYEDGRWAFQLNCDSVRMSWISNWPVIQHPKP